jgi:hypothetical protein
MSVEQAGKRVVDQKEVFALAQGGEWIEPLEFGINETGMTQFTTLPSGSPRRNLRKDLGIVRVLRKAVSDQMR